MRTVLVLLTALALTPVALAAVPSPVPVAAAGFAFASPVLVVPAGTTVEWQAAALDHTVTTAADLLTAQSGTPNDPDNADGRDDTFHVDLPMGATFSHTFSTPGEYAYYCELHARMGMVGLIVVV